MPSGNRVGVESQCSNALLSRAVSCNGELLFKPIAIAILHAATRVPGNNYPSGLKQDSAIESLLHEEATVGEKFTGAFFSTAGCSLSEPFTATMVMIAESKSEPAMNM